MRGSFVLNELEVDMVVPIGRPGVYGLSHSRNEIEVIQRAEQSVRDELRAYVSDYKYFWFDVATSGEDAFNLECEVCHSTHPKKAADVHHPVAPVESNWHCPICKK